MALCQMTAESPQKIKLPLLLDSLRHDIDVEASREIDDCGDDRGDFPVVQHLLDE